jgi:hypothetical protein
VSFENGDFKNQISVFVHEVLHALVFDPSAWQNFPNNSSGETFLFKDTDNRYKLRGDNILKLVRDHYNCPTATGGILLKKLFYLKFLK